MPRDAAEVGVADGPAAAVSASGLTFFLWLFLAATGASDVVKTFKTAGALTEREARWSLEGANGFGTLRASVIDSATSAAEAEEGTRSSVMARCRRVSQAADVSSLVEKLVEVAALYEAPGSTPRSFATSMS